jgi:hypothetical protein
MSTPAESERPTRALSEDRVTTVHFFFPISSEAMDRIVGKMQRLRFPGGRVANYDAETRTLSVIDARIQDGVARPTAWAFLGPMSRRQAARQARAQLGLSSRESIDI